MHTGYSKSVARFFALALVALVPVALAAQDSAKPAKASENNSPSKWDIFVGYSYLAPKGTVYTPLGATTVPVDFESINAGEIMAVARFFNNYVGAEIVGDIHMQDEKPGPNGWNGSKNDFSGGGAGMIFRYPTGNITPFAHALVGGERVGGPHFQADKWGIMLTAGGGVDYETPLLHHRLAIRIVQADYQYVHEDWGTGEFGGRGNANVARLSAGVVLHIGSFTPPPPVTLTCSASPTAVFPGEPVTVTATAGELDPKLNAIYTWSGTGVTGKGTTATVDTAALTAGSYTVKAEVKEGKAGKEGAKPGQTADCSASFTVKAYEPPTISCSASPSTIKPGETSTITSMGMSPQNRPLTYSYSAASGSISGTGTSATFSSTGAPTGVVGITCNVSDDKGQTATANTSVTITAPYVAPIPHTQALCSLAFDKDKKRPTRVDNEAKACLDEVALDLQKQPDAKAVVVGEQNAKETEKVAKEEKVAQKHKHAKVENFAGERAVNTKEYLVTEKGIDASRVSVATGSTDGQTVEDYLVPAGATFTNDVQGTTPVDETAVKPVVRKPLGERHPAKKHAKEAAK
jgi:hypothetical protein